MKAQAAFEYMVTFIIVLSFVIPVWFYVISMQGDTTEELYLTWARIAAENIAEKADLVYSQGFPAKVRIEIYMPKNVIESFLDDKTVVIKMRVDSYETYITSTSTSPLTGNIPSTEGVYWLHIEAENDHVEICYGEYC